VVNHWLIVVNSGKSLVNYGWLVLEPSPLKNDGLSSSVGMMTFQTEWEKNVPNHQPGQILEDDLEKILGSNPSRT
jgi:hypothetical protein